MNATFAKDSLRFFHIFTSVVFVFCMGFLVYAIFSNYRGEIDNISAFVLLIEAIAVIANDGKCPLRNLHKKHEKDERLMNAFFPEKVGNFLIRAFVVVTTIVFLSWNIMEFLIN